MIQLGLLLQARERMEKTSTNTRKASKLMMRITIKLKLKGPSTPSISATRNFREFCSKIITPQTARSKMDHLKI